LEHEARLLIGTAFLRACATAPAPPPAPAVSSALLGDAARPASDAGWVRSELYFGVGDEAEASKRIDDAHWRAFLDREVTPRFPVTSPDARTKRPPPEGHTEFRAIPTVRLSEMLDVFEPMMIN